MVHHRRVEPLTGGNQTLITAGVHIRPAVIEQFVTTGSCYKMTKHDQERQFKLRNDNDLAIVTAR
jgi:hypothetical protein